jgi:hypothetical protein
MRLGEIASSGWTSLSRPTLGFHFENKAHDTLLLCASPTSPCMNPSSESRPSDTAIRDAVPPAVVIILAEDPDGRSNTLKVQDYVRDGTGVRVRRDSRFRRQRSPEDKS